MSNFYNPKLLKGETVEDYLDRSFGWPAGCMKKINAMTTEYELKLCGYKLIHPDATRSELRHELLPPLVRSIYKDWSPLKQEYLVWAGVEVWFDIEKSGEKQAWVDFGECCARLVHRQGFISGKGDRELFGWTAEVDQWSDPDAKINWSEDEAGDSDEEDDHNGETNHQTQNQTGQ